MSARSVLVPMCWVFVWAQTSHLSAYPIGYHTTNQPADRWPYWFDKT